MSETIPKCRTCKTEIKWHEPMKIINNKCYCRFCHEKDVRSRLEEIKRLWEENNDFPVDPAEYEWLISRVEELESNLHEMGKECGQLEGVFQEIKEKYKKSEEENKRYREALEEIRDPHPLNGIETASLIAQRALEEPE